MFDAFSHYISYGATDQQTARALTGSYDGLLVPGTVAAFQADGTKGFVLTLSASRQTRYVIDSRFPLYQNRLRSPKKSHESLAEVLGSSWLVSAQEPVVSDFTPDRIDVIAQNWLEFNSGYTEVSAKHFSKYAQRLGEEVVSSNRSSPEYVLPPYTMCDSVDDPWWDIASRLWSRSVDHAPRYAAERKLVRVVASKRAAALESLIRDAGQDRMAIWVTKLDELDTSPEAIRSLAEYGRAIRRASLDGHSLFALYGGFFSVLLGQLGLRGSSHGIGYGEARDWVELPTSGPPPARYYVPRIHRYVSQDLAAFLYRQPASRTLVECDCAECDGRDPSELDYHALMRHSVRCRQEEIQQWLPLAPEESITLLLSESDRFDETLQYLEIPRALRRQADNCYAHLRSWALALEGAGQ